MSVDDLVLISLDDHVIEPPDLFVRHLPAALADRAPRFADGPDGPAWYFGRGRTVIPALSACAGQSPGDYDASAVSIADIRRGAWDVIARLEDMDADGVFASLCFPHMPGLVGQLFAESSDLDLGLRLLQAYNDWYAADWAGAAPERLIQLAILPLWNVPLAVAEVQRVAALGARAVSFPEQPVARGLPSLHDERWAPLWRACEELGIVLCLHVGSGSPSTTSVDAPPLVQLTLQSLRTIDVAADLVWSGLFLRHPGLRFCLPSHGADWLVPFLRRVEATYVRHRSWGGIDYGELRPAAVFRERVLTCFIEDTLPRGSDMSGIAWSSDYPHADSPWPCSPETVAAATAGLTDEERAAVTHGNATEHFGLAPVPAGCNVGELRARRA